MLGVKSPVRVAEFFAGVGLVRLAVERQGASVVFANDLDATKARIYAANFGGGDFLLRDVRRVRGDDVPSVDLATASFPCTDLSLAGGRAGLAGKHSGTLLEFFRVLSEMGARQPRAVLLENVPGFATSRGGRDLAAAVASLNDLGYRCDLVALDARRFVPQSRVRLFVVAATATRPPLDVDRDDPLRPAWLRDFARARPELGIVAAPLPAPPESGGALADVVERLAPEDPRWWDEARRARFTASLSPLQAERLRLLTKASRVAWATAYRRTRGGRPTWEVRADDVAGCLRTTRGGSSKQALVETGGGRQRVRWMTAREYARLMGAGDLDFADATESQARFALGDAVCVPAVAWLAEHAVLPLARGASPSAGRRIARGG